MVSLSPFVAEARSWNLLICSLNGIIHLSPLIHATVLYECECVCLLYLESIKVVLINGFYPFFPSWIFFFLNRTIDLCFRTEVSQVFVSHPLWGCGSQSRSNNDPHKSLHEPLTAENKTLLLTWKEMRRKKSTFVVGGLSPYQTWKTTMISHVDKSQAQISTWIPHSCNGKHLCKSKPDDKQYSRINKKAQLCWRKAQR